MQRIRWLYSKSRLGIPITKSKLPIMRGRLVTFGHEGPVLFSSRRLSLYSPINESSNRSDLIDSKQTISLDFTTDMATVEIKISDELLKAANVPQERSSEEVSKLLALELYRERAISLGRAAELGGVSTAEFMQFAGQREVELDFDLNNLERDRQTLESLNQ